jgi:type IV pilus biogenesis protein CpaD/CtpE
MLETVKSRAKQLNVNSVLLVALWALLKWEAGKLYDKVEASSTAVTQVTVRITDLDRKVGEMVTRGEFRTELSRRDEVIADLQKAVEGLQHPGKRGR